MLLARALLSLCLALTGGNALPAAPELAPGITPVVDERFNPPGSQVAFADPFVMPVGEDYFLFGTSSRCAHTRLFTPEDTTVMHLELDLAGEEQRGAYQVWSFRPYRHTDGSYHGYGSLHYGQFRTVVGHFSPAPGEVWTDSRPILRWRLDRILAGSLDAGQYAYDSNLVADEDGTLYLIYNAAFPETGLAGGISILAQRMLDPATPDPAFAARALLSPQGLRSEDRNPGGMQLVEGVQLYHIQDQWVLLYSVGDFDDANYKLGAAFSDTLLPPPGQTYRKILAPDPANVWGNPAPGDEIRYLLQTEHPEWPNYCGEVINGPGIGNLVEVAPGSWILVFHARRPGVTRLHGQGRYVWKVPVRVNLAPETPLEERLVPLL
jgi:hypothetical protein